MISLVTEWRGWCRDWSCNPTIRWLGFNNLQEIFRLLTDLWLVSFLGSVLIKIINCQGIMFRLGCNVHQVGKWPNIPITPSSNILSDLMNEAWHSVDWDVSKNVLSCLISSWLKEFCVFWLANWHVITILIICLRSRVYSMHEGLWLIERHVKILFMFLFLLKSAKKILHH